MASQEIYFLSQLLSEGVNLSEFSELIKVPRGHFIYRTGEQPKGLYLVKKGLVGLNLDGPSGKQHLMRFFKEGQVFGHRALLAEEAYHASTLVLEDTEIRLIPRTRVNEIFESHPRFYQAMVKQLALELHHCETQQVNILDQQVLPRIAQAIVYLKDLHPEYRWTRSELAAFCASTTATVIKGLADLEYMGYIKQKGREIIVLDRNALIQLQFQKLNVRPDAHTPNG